MNELNEKLQRIGKIFDPEAIMEKNTTADDIRWYFKVNKIPYSKYHSREGLLHFGISRDGQFKPSDLLESPRIVASHIESDSAKEVLELGTGRGANCAFLAGAFPDVNFTGIDFSPVNLEFALKKAARLANYTAQVGDFHDLALLPEKMYDIVFTIEALSYSTRKDVVLREVAKKLKKGGKFIVIDGYSKIDKDTPEEGLLAVNLFSRGMTVENLETYDSFRRKIAESDFNILEEEDVTEYVMPNARNYESRFNRFESSFLWSKILMRLLPRDVTKNAITAGLMASLIRHDLFSYHVTVLERK